MLGQNDAPARVCESDPDDPYGMLEMLALRLISLRDSLRAERTGQPEFDGFRHFADVVRRTLNYTKYLITPFLPLLHLAAENHLEGGQYKLGLVSGTSACEALLNLTGFICARVFVFVDNETTADGQRITKITDDQRKNLLTFLNRALGFDDRTAATGIHSELLAKALTVARGELMTVAAIYEMTEAVQGTSGHGGAGDGETSSTPAPKVEPTKTAADGSSKAGSRMNVSTDFEKRLESPESQTKKPPKPPTKTERIRDQRIKFCWSMWHKSKTKGENEWRNIEEAYRKKIASDPKLIQERPSHDAIRLQHDRYCVTCKHPTYFNPDGTRKADC